MKIDKFQLNYKCDCFQPENICNCSDKVLSVEVHVERLKAVSEALVDVSAYLISYISYRNYFDIFVYIN